jgi:GT2 family glycosyltransferase
MNTLEAAEAVESLPSVPPRIDTPDLSIVVVSWNTRQLLADCLHSVYAHTGDLRVEVFVVDNASQDSSAAMVRENFPAVHLIENTANTGFARANNQALRNAAGRCWLLLNPDTIVPFGALAQLVATLDARPDAAVCSPLLFNPDGSPQFCWARFPGVRSELLGELDLTQAPYPLPEFADPARRAAMQPFAADWVGGACFLVRAAAAEQVGLLDESFFFYGEETDWCRRFRDAGWRTLLVPAATVTHIGGQSAKTIGQTARRLLWQSRLRLYSRLYGPLGGLIPSVIATVRYALSRFRRKGEG